MHKLNLRNTFVAIGMMSFGCGLATAGCTADDETADDASLVADTPQGGENLGFEPAEEQLAEGELGSLDKLPFVDAIESAETFIQLLPEPTASGENVAVHMKLPQPHNKELGSSLVRVVGDPKNPLVVFKTDALAELGMIDESPGEDFFTAFLILDEAEIERRKWAEELFANAEEPSETLVLFNGRTPVAITTGIAFNPDIFFDHKPVPLGSCPIQPLSQLARWEESLMITDLEVVQDSDRTHDTCGGGGNPDGVWTFKHLMEEMAIGSGMSTHDFVVHWLSNWLNDYTVNGDVVPERLAMFSQVIEPWANASGVTASLGLGNELILSGPLKLEIAPFRLSAIVNRLDLGGTSSSPGGYGGGTVDTPTDAGELRFVFGVQNLDNCKLLRFSVIFEYGVPITGCEAVRDWAIEWTKLNDPSFAPRFSDPWRAHLETLTESVVKHGAAPLKGNKNAINQIRTNEIALDSQWEFREFTLSIEDPIADTNTPADGPLLPHTVAMTPDDTVFHPTPNGTVDQFVLNDVLPSVPTGTIVDPFTLPDDCKASYAVPGQFLGAPFRGGNSFTAGSGPVTWFANVNPGDPRELCARHQFSLNTCNGCHFADTAASFFQVDPTLSPAGLSDFLTGGITGIHEVNDTQFGAPTVWRFRDLDMRFERLYAVACAQCGGSIGIKPEFIDLIAELAEVVPIDPIDPIGPIEFPHPIGPIHDLGIVKELLGLRTEFANQEILTNIEIDHFARRGEVMVH